LQNQPSGSVNPAPTHINPTPTHLLHLAPLSLLSVSLRYLSLLPSCTSLTLAPPFPQHQSQLFSRKLLPLNF
jgi:hypothetical protein